jgi:hypothetical protein
MCRNMIQSGAQRMGGLIGVPRMLRPNILAHPQVSTVMATIKPSRTQAATAKPGSALHAHKCIGCA